MVRMEDPVDVIVDELTASWTQANTDNKKPTITAIYDVKRIDAGNADYVLVYALDHTERAASLGFTHIDYIDTVSIDIRTSSSRARMIKVRDEVRRLIYAKRKSLSGYKQLGVIRGKDLSDRSIKLWRYVIDVKLWKILTTVPS